MATNVTLPVALNASFVYDGNTSDLAQQFYARYAKGDSLASMTVANPDLPTAIQSRLEKNKAAVFSELPGLLQLALVWDTGYVFDEAKNFLQVWTLGGRSMADIFVTKQEYEGVGCTPQNCSQPNGVMSYRSKICTGTNMLKAVKCVADTIVKPSSVHAAMWATGASPDVVPGIKLLDHSWADSFSGVQYQVYAIHTERDDGVAYENCPAANVYDSVVVPCYPKGTINDTLMGKMTEPKASAWVDTWLAAFPKKSSSSSAPSTTGSSSGTTAGATTTNSKSSSGVGAGAIIGIIAGVVVVIAVIAFFVVRKRRNNNKKASSDGTVDPNTLLTPGGKDFSQDGMSTASRPTMTTTMTTGNQLTTMGRTTEDYGSSGSNTVLKSLYTDPNLVDNRLVFEKIQFQKLLSKGAYGEVWICQYEDQTVAVKRLLQSKTHTFEEVRDFTNEIQLSASLHHPNVVNFVGVAWNSLENLVMAVEYLPMGDLQNYLKKNADLLSWARDKIHMALGIARALEYIHGRDPPLIHRDMKSKNVLLTDRLDAKLIDFGVSRNFQHEAMTAGVGTPYWTAPEILEGTVYSEQSDIFSFGVLLSELDTCELPYFDASGPSGEKLKAFQILNDVMAGTLHPSFTAECPPRIKMIAEACFQRDPAQRPTAKQLVEMLEGN
ncbi:Tkl/drk protein kinase [Globisporangium polare]